jgi:hypothetical protein
MQSARVIRARLGRGAVTEQHLDHHRVLLNPRGDVQRRAPVRVTLLPIGAALQQQPHHLDRAPLDRLEERVRIGARIEQDLRERR